MIKTLEQIKAELRFLHKKNPDLDVEMKYEKSRKERYDWCIENGMTKEAEQIADSILALKVGEKLIGVNTLDCEYTKVFALLEEEDRQLAMLAFMQGKTYQKIAKTMGYDIDAIKFKFAGGRRRGKHYIGLYEKIQKIVNGGG